MTIHKWLTRFPRTWRNFWSLHHKTVKNRYFMAADGRSPMRIAMINLRLAAFLG